jgi:RHH-type transcriptional regulator, proline utilization regulon repressor / proline dehydrogenase / delta 1-pyrroline-5-carboxylate dehydrogenase
MLSTTAHQSRIEQIGQDIFERAQASQPRIWEQAWWQRFMIDLGAQFETLQVQAFRFIDVLPVLRSDVEIARHVAEFLDPTRFAMPQALRGLLSYDRPDALRGRLVAQLARFAARTMATGFIAGSNAEEAIASVERFRRQKMGFTLDVLGEFTSSASQAAGYKQTYLDLMNNLCPAARNWSAVPKIDIGPRVNISIKLTALTPHFDAIDPERSIANVTAALRPLLRRAKELGAFINVDMESFAYRDLTFELFMRLLEEEEFRDVTDIGIVVQAYLRDAERDYDRLLEWVQHRGHPISVRLVKGAYWDVETALATQNNVPPPVWINKWESDACFERIAERMLDNHEWTRPAFASHNVRSIASVIAGAERRGLSRRAYEFQMLNGMGDPLKRAVVDLGHRVRVYTPYGELIPGMGYLIRRLLENTANDSFLRQSYRARDASRLLADPQVSRPQSTRPRSIRFVDSREDEPMPAFRNEPIKSFTNATDRDGLIAALDYVRGGFTTEYPLVIEGKKMSTGRWIDSVNPANPSQTVGRVACASLADADHAVAAATRALTAWRKVPAAERATCLHRAADLIRKRRFEFDAMLTYEAGKPWREADAETAEAIDYLDYYAECATLVASNPRRRDLPGEDNHLVYEPKGVCVVLAPWSFPLALLTNMTAAALAAGNTVVLKPASQTPVIAAMLAEVLTEAGIPDGVLNFLPGPGSLVGRHLVSHSGVNVVSITGSREVGIEVIRSAGEAAPGQRHIKKVIAELGGKNAIIVDDDADLDEAVAGVIKSAFAFSGQKCTSASRVVVLEGVYDDCCERLVRSAGSLIIGPPEQPGTFVGPLIDESSRQTVRSYIEAGRTQGKVIYETNEAALPTDGYYVGPTIIADVDPEAPLAQDEIFGPVLSVIKANDFDHALEIANNTRYALTGGVYSRSPAHIEKAKRDFLVGNLYINRKITGSRVDIEPFGGLKMSGDGAKAGGPDYLHHYCNARTITEHTLRHGLAPAQEVESKA